MIIGVDAYYLYARQIDGLGTYLLRLLEELSRVDRVNEYLLYTPGVTHEKRAKKILSNPRFRLSIVPGVFSDHRRLWLQSPSLRSRIIKDNLDLFFAGAEYFPLFIPRVIPVAVTIHDVAYRAVPGAISFSNKLFYRLFFPLFIRRADHFFTVSRHSRDELVRYLGIDRTRIIVIHNGIDLDSFHPAGKNGKKDYILFVGTLQPRKNLLNLVRAFELIAGSIPHRLLIVGGSGWKNSPLRDLIEGLEPSVREKIVFKGYVDGQELGTLYREAALFTLLSLHEGFCLPILEALASGTPALASPVTAIPEVYGDAIEYADPLLPGDIAEKIYGLLTDTDRLDFFREKGLALSRTYGLGAQANAYLSAFNAIGTTRVCGEEK
ncbi:MAG: glycosyltransferase family 1 protein [Chrysiogenales bacterium]|nr:MAG: glycosyltransferase family 1 protein [Chrysiogenales bacterium]